MKKILYFDCFAGISGDMTLGALAALGVPADYLRNELHRLGLSGWSIHFIQTERNGIAATKANVEAAEHHEHRHTTHKEIKALIEDSSLNDNVKALSLRIFEKVAQAEAKVHGMAAEDVAFHEVGAVDSIVDIVGAAICVDYLKPDAVEASIVRDGQGFIKCRHGLIPVPVPAVVEIFAAHNVPFKQLDVDTELVTPTGAAILAALCGRFGNMPDGRVVRTGYGAGTKVLAIPNALRTLWIEQPEAARDEDAVTVIEANVDDCSPEILGYVMDALFAAGAKDVFYTPVLMKKSRLGTLMTVLCAPEDRPVMERILFAETTTIGLRYRAESRRVLPRRHETAATPFGDIDVKVCEADGIWKRKAEFESVKRAAEKYGVPLKEVYDAIARTEK